MKKLFLFSLALLAAAVLAAPALGSSVSAQNVLQDSAKCEQVAGTQCICPPDSTDPECQADTAGSTQCVKNNCPLFTKYLNPFIRSLTVLVGLGVTIGIIVGGIQYASSGGDPQKAASGKQHIKVAVIALVGFMFLYGLLRFLFPGVTG
jgi:hypothetical protein